MQEPYKKTLNQMAEKQVESQNCRDGEPDPYIIIILTQLWKEITRNATKIANCT